MAKLSGIRTQIPNRSLVSQATHINAQVRGLIEWYGDEAGLDAGWLLYDQCFGRQHAPLPTTPSTPVLGSRVVRCSCRCVPHAAPPAAARCCPRLSSSSVPLAQPTCAARAHQGRALAALLSCWPTLRPILPTPPPLCRRCPISSWICSNPSTGRWRECCAATACSCERPGSTAAQPTSYSCS